MALTWKSSRVWSILEICSSLEHISFYENPDVIVLLPLPCNRGGPVMSSDIVTYRVYQGFRLNIKRWSLWPLVTWATFFWAAQSWPKISSSPKALILLIGQIYELNKIAKLVTETYVRGYVFRLFSSQNLKAQRDNSRARFEPRP